MEKSTEKNIFSFLENVLNRNVEKIAVRYLDEDGDLHEITYSQFATDIRKAIGWMASNLHEISGSHIGIIANPSYEYLVCLYAIIGSSAVAIPLNIQKTWSEIQNEIRTAELSWIFHDGEYGLSYPEFLNANRNILLPINGYTKSDFLMPWCNPDQASLSMILFTSGTTAFSKAVTLSYRALIANCQCYSEYYSNIIKMHKLSDIQFFFCLSFYHTFPLGMTISAIYNGFSISLNTSGKYIERDLEVLPCNCSAMVPLIAVHFYKRLKKGKCLFSSKLKDIICAGAPFDSEIKADIEDYGIHITLHYGLSESSVGTINYCKGTYKCNSVGIPFYDGEIKIVNHEILFKSKAMMDGYYNDPVSTCNTIEDGWLHTGDLGYMDDDGFLILSGRKKNLIILDSGENVNAEELETLLIKCPYITETRVVEKEKHICAEIYCDFQNREQISLYIKEMNMLLPAYKKITLVEFRKEPFPKTGSGKIKRGLEEQRNESP